jgi:large subunit ribosomal protein L22
MSARKMRLVVDLISGKNVEEALDILRFTKKEAAVWLRKISPFGNRKLGI